MKGCTALPSSSARIGEQRWRCVRQIQVQVQIKRRSSTRRPQNSASPFIPETAEPQPSCEVDQDNKTIATAVGDLPLSPIMDPSYWEATSRYKTPKLKQGKAQNSLERQFRKSPFAKALATPIRQCTASKVRLPTFFLQDFNLINHPETGKPWWVPRSLAPMQRVKPEQANMESDETSADIPDCPDEQSNIEATKSEAISRKETPKKDTSKEGTSKAGTAKAEMPKAEEPAAHATGAKVYGPSAYVLAREDLLSGFSIGGSGFAGHPRRMFGGSSSRFVKFSSKAVWREDMSSFVLNRMREGIMTDLRYLSALCVEDERYYIVRCHGWDDIKYKHSGAVLWFGEPEKTNDAADQPGPYAIYNFEHDGVATSAAVHNMPRLLGAENAAKLRQEAAAFADGSLFMLSGRRTTDLQLKFWKIQGYLSYTKSGQEGQKVRTKHPVLINPNA